MVGKTLEGLAGDRVGGVTQASNKLHCLSVSPDPATCNAPIHRGAENKRGLGCY